MKYFLKITLVSCTIFLASAYPEILLVSTQNDTVSFEELKNSKQPKLLYFWATTCHVCQKEIPQLNQLMKEFPDGLIVPIAYQNSLEDVRSFMNKKSLVMDSYIDFSGALFKELKIQATPTALIFDQNGKTAFNGYASMRAINRKLKKLSDL